MFSHLSGTAGVVLSLFAFGSIVACSESFTDERDGQSYDVVEIGGQTWMAENLNFDIGAAGASGAASVASVPGAASVASAARNAASFCPEGDARNCSKYGRLYTWDAAQNACPMGWRLPTREEFESLVAAAGNGSAAKAGAALKATSGWFKKGNGNDAVHFRALPAGFMSAVENSDGSAAGAGKFDGIGGCAYFWSSATDPEEPAFAQYLFLDFSSDAAEIRSFVKSSAYSVRCVRQ